MRVRPSLVVAVTALLGFLVVQSALGSPPAAPTPEPVIGMEPVAFTTADAQAQPAARPAGHVTAFLSKGVVASDRPGGPAIGTIPATTEFGSPKVLSVVQRRGPWLGVVTTGRPNNKLTWIRRNATGLRLGRTLWSLHADLSSRKLTLKRGKRVMRRVTVAIGRPGSDTPTGRFAVTDKLAGSNYGPYYGCCILALTGTQPNLPPGWTGGNRLAIHGTDAPSTVGTAASAGCLRAGESDLRALMDTVPLGTPVFIRA